MASQVSAPQKEENDNYMFGLKNVKIADSHATRTAEENCRYMLPTVLRMYESNPKIKLLDVGCGPGSITASLAKYIPNGEVIGVDLSPTFIDKARDHIREQGVKNVTFQQADVYSLPFDDNTFDVVHTHQAVAHFYEHVRAIKELVRVTKKGGVVCMREGDLHTVRFYPPYPVLEECFNPTLLAVVKAEGGTTDAGRRLKAWTVQAGVSRENIQTTSGGWCYHTAQSRRDFNGGRIMPPGSKLGERAVELGLVTREQLEDIEKAWRQWEDDEDGVMMMMHGEVVAHI